MSALREQVGGNHYKEMAIQPVEFAQKNGLNYCEASVLRYICRHRWKGGVEDLRKAKHCIDLLMEMEYAERPPEEDRREDPRAAAWSDLSYDAGLEEAATHIEDVAESWEKRAREVGGLEGKARDSISGLMKELALELRERKSENQKGEEKYADGR